MEDEPIVFIVDDDDAVRDSLKFFLESHGWNVEDFTSTREFLSNYRPRERQCLVLDHHLPGETGVDFLESIAGASLRLPVIVVSGGGDKALHERALRAGAIAFFDKPINDSLLLATITKALGET